MSYFIPGTLKEALLLLQNAKGKAKVIAGGTDMFLEPLPGALVDITQLAELKVVEEQEGKISLGACVTHAQAACSNLLEKKGSVLAQACRQVGSPQVRNLGTLGGNVVNAAPAADAAVALVTLKAQAVLAAEGEIYREEAVEDLYARYLTSRVDSSKEILVKFVFEAQKPGEGSHLERFATRKALALPLFSVAAFVRVKEGLLDEVRLTAAPVKPWPTRLTQTEERLTKMAATDKTLNLAADLVREEITVRGSALRCTEEYRYHLAGVLATRALKEAAKKAENSKAGEN